MDASVVGKEDAPLVQATCEMLKGDPGEVTARERSACPMLETVRGSVAVWPAAIPPKPRLPAEKYATGTAMGSVAGIATTRGVSVTVIGSLSETSETTGVSVTVIDSLTVIFTGDGGADEVTVSVAVPLAAPCVAVIVAVPPVNPVANPLALTEATPAGVEVALQVMVPGIALVDPLL
jgi:hypothetical protein